MECSQGEPDGIFTLTIPLDIPQDPQDIIHPENQ